MPSWIYKALSSNGLIGTVIVLGLISSGISLYLYNKDSLRFSRYEPVEVANRKFVNEKVILDGFFYKHCSFTNVTFVYNGKTPVNLSDVDIIGSYSFETESDPVGNAFQLMKAMRLFKEPFPITIGPERKEWKP